MTDDVKCGVHNMTRAEHGEPDPYSLDDDVLGLAHCLGTCDPSLCCEGLPENAAGTFWATHPDYDTCIVCLRPRWVHRPVIVHDFTKLGVS